MAVFERQVALLGKVHWRIGFWKQRRRMGDSVHVRTGRLLNTCILIGYVHLFADLGYEYLCND